MKLSLLKSLNSGFSCIKNKEFWAIFVAIIGLTITLSPRPNFIVKIDTDTSRREYVSTELINTGNAAAYNFKYNLIPEIETKDGVFVGKNPQEILFGKNIILPDQIYQAGRQVPIIAGESIEKVLVKYVIQYKYSLFNIPFLNRIKFSNKVDGLLNWNNAKWEIR